jgi:hypothetical protein
MSSIETLITKYMLYRRLSFLQVSIKDHTERLIEKTDTIYIIYEPSAFEKLCKHSQGFR